MAYTKTVWENSPSTNTPISNTNLNKIEQGIYQNSLKADQVGDLSTLTTTSKTTLVDAINELKDGEEYSTTEVKTNGIYNNKPIYRRILTVNTTTTTGSATNLVQTPYIDTLISCYHYVLASNLIYLGSSPVSLYYNPSTKYFQESHSDTWWNNKAITMILEYTKTN
jgi:hypothetical protein